MLSVVMAPIINGITNPRTPENVQLVKLEFELRDVRRKTEQNYQTK
jgi:hypothetical protein